MSESNGSATNGMGTSYNEVNYGVGTVSSAPYVPSTLQDPKPGYHWENVLSADGKTKTWTQVKDKVPAPAPPPAPATMGPAYPYPPAPMALPKLPPWVMVLIVGGAAYGLYYWFRKRGKSVPLVASNGRSRGRSPKRRRYEEDEDDE